MKLNSKSAVMLDKWRHQQQLPQNSISCQQNRPFQCRHQQQQKSVYFQKSNYLQHHLEQQHFCIYIQQRSSTKKHQWRDSVSGQQQACSILLQDDKIICHHEDDFFNNSNQPQQQQHINNHQDNGAAFLISLLLLLPSLLLSSCHANMTNKGVWRRVEALSGREAVLPCEVGALDETDMIYVVLWYKNGDKEPIYSYDNRPRGLQPAEDRHIIQSPILKGRVTFRPGLVPALHIRPVSASDQANYTCRVDFRIASSRSTHLSLQVVVPPSQPLLQLSGRLLQQSDTIGPLLEGQQLKVTCLVEGGVPPPSLIWYRGNQIIDAVTEPELRNLVYASGSSSNRERYRSRGRRTLSFFGSFSRAHRAGSSGEGETRSYKRSRVYRTMVTRGLNSHNTARRNIRGRGISYRRGLTIRSLVSYMPKSELKYTFNQLVISYLTRDLHDEKMSCVASNNNVTAPTSAHLTITMNLRPLTTRLVSPPKELRVGQTYDIKCITSGSRPQPNITWTLGNVASLYTVPSVTEHSTNVSLSSVRLTAERRIHGQRLTCKAVNNLFPTHPLTDSLLLNVTYPPVASLELGRGVPSVVREGEDVYFNCMVDSNPPTYKISWFHEDTLLVHAPSHGLVVSGQSLALRNVRRKQAGRYACSASNVEGDAMSPPVILHVSYAPVCSSNTDTTQVLATGIGQSLNVSCSVIASPSDVKFSWVFNNSVTSERIPVERVYNGEGGWSGVMFVARTQQDYGTLQCWAQNSVGEMDKPCLFHIVPAGRPDMPLNCSVINKTYDSLVVTCTEGFNGGLRQSFVSRVYEAVTGRGQVNVSSPEPKFTLEGLTPGLDYIIKVSSINQLGESDPVKLEAVTYKMAENRMRDETVSSSVSNNGNLHPRADVVASGRSSSSFSAGALLGGLLIILGAVLMTGLLLRCASVRRRQRRRNLRREHSQAQREEEESRRKSNLIVTADGGGGSVTTGGSLMFLPPPPMLEEHSDDDGVAVRMLQRIPTDTDTPFEISTLDMAQLSTQVTGRRPLCGSCQQLTDQPL
uniref:Hemicentin-2-like n=3 Tax=Hirondellea gigas TaxID=1518452 RepID=A0A6A7G5C3_9CRUS